MSKMESLLHKSFDSLHTGGGRTREQRLFFFPAISFSGVFRVFAHRKRDFHREYIHRLCSSSVVSL